MIVALRPAPHVGQIDVFSLSPQSNDRHVARGERPRLVGTDDGGRAQRLDTGQTAHEGFSVRHPPYANSQGNGRHCGQRFGHCRDGKCDPRLNDQPERCAVDCAQRRHERRDGEGDPNKAATELIQPPFQRRPLFPHAAHKRADSSELGVLAGGRDEDTRRTGNDGRALVGHVGPLGERSVLWHWFEGFRWRQRLTGESGLVGAQVGGFDHPTVGCHLLAAIDLDHVARDERVCVDGAGLPASDDKRARNVEFQQRRHRATGSKLRDKAEERVDREDAANGSGVEPLAEHESYACRSDEQQHHDAAKLVSENLES